MSPRIHAQPACGAPVLPNALRILETHEGSRRAHGRFHCQASVDVDGQPRAAHEGPREASIRGELQGIAGGPCHGLARVAADEGPLLHLPLKLNHVKRILIRARRRGGEVRGFAFDREPGERNGRVAAVEAKLGIVALERDGRSQRIVRRGE